MEVKCTGCMSGAVITKIAIYELDESYDTAKFQVSRCTEIHIAVK